MWQLLLDCHTQASPGQNGGGALADSERPLIHDGRSCVVNPVREFECTGGSHLRDGPAQQVNHLLVRVAVAIIENDAGFQPITGEGVRFFHSFGKRG